MTALNDVYASRRADTPSLVDRVDPVVYWGHGVQASGPLTNEQLKQYERDGFLFFDGFFDADTVNLFRETMDELRSSAAIKSAEESITEPGSGDVRSVFAVHKLSPMFQALARDRRMLDMARQILGSEVYIHQSRINYKPGFNGKEFYWHSDFETWHMEDGLPRMRTLSCSILLTDNNPFNGPLMVVPKSQNRYVVCVGKTPENHYKQSLKMQEYGVPSPQMLTDLIDEGGIRAPTGPAGSLLLFDCNVMHGSAGNISPWPRSNVFLVYNSVENAPEAPFCGLKSRPPFVGERDELDALEPIDPDYAALMHKSAHGEKI